MTTPLPDSYWADDHLLASPWPGHPARPEQRRRLRALIEAGVRLVIDLTVEGERPRCRVALTRLEPELSWVNVPIADGRAPSPATTAVILDLIAAARARGERVYLHCAGGLGRTGTIVACWWIRRGLAPAEEVVARLREARAGQPNEHRPSPESPEQMRHIQSWAATCGARPEVVEEADY